MFKHLAEFTHLASTLPSTLSSPPLSSPRVLLSLTPKVSTITLSNIDKKNALTPSMMIELSHHIEALSSMDKNGDLPPIIILKGASNTFCSGADISQAQHFMTPDKGEVMSKFMTEITNKLSRLPAISFSAIDGYAFGGGAELVTCTDFRCLGESGKVRFVQAGMGVTTGWGGGRRLKGIIGETKALKLLLYRDTITHSTETRPGRSKSGLIDVLSTPGQTAEGAIMSNIDLLGDVDPKVIKALKSGVVAETCDDESAAFRSVWGGEAHVTAFEKAMSKRK